MDQLSIKPIEEEDQSSDQDLEKIEPINVVRPEMIRSDYMFKGKPLWPYSLATRVMFNQIIDTKDKMLFVWAAFLFLLIRRGESTASEDRKKHILPLWDNGEMRAAVLDWIDGLKEADLLEAKEIYDKWMASDQATSVEPVPETGTRVQKKTRRKKVLSSVGS